jgi:hypothetical protein
MPLYTYVAVYKDGNYIPHRDAATFKVLETG